jgi:hypothetical protein
MAFRYPNNYSFAILRQGNDSRRSLHTDTDIRSRLYIDPCRQPLILDVGDEVGGSGPRARISRLQPLAPNLFSPVSRTGARRQRDRTLRISDVSTRESKDVDEYGRRRGRTEIVRERNDVLPFSITVNELQRQLGDAIKFYEDFNSKYENDIDLIKKYATKEVLENLWTMKVMSKEPATASHDEYDDQDSDNLLAESEDQFAIWKRTLSHALDGAISSGMREGNLHDPNGTRHQSMTRLVDKIRMANQQLLPLFDTAWKRPEFSSDLVTELKMLHGLIKSGRGNSEDPR